VTAGAEDSIRIRPDQWIDPIPLHASFELKQPLEIDLGCGKGRFLLAHAQANPSVNFLGIDRMLGRIRRIDQRARRRGLRNIRLLRVEAYYATTYLVPPGCVQTYYIFHPDPWPKKRHHENRLFNPRFIDALHRTLIPGGTVHISTDHLPYHAEIRSVLDLDQRFEPVDPFVPGESEQTDFERWYIHRGPIGRCSYQRR